MIAIKHKQKGFSLLELMVTLLISSILLAGTLSVLTNNFSIFRSNDRFSKINENATTAISFMTSDLDMVGFKGCGSSVVTNVPAGNPGDLLEIVAGGLLGDELMSLDGLDNSTNRWTRFNSNQLSASIAAGTDAITIRKLRNFGASITADMANPNAAITADTSTLQVQANDIVAIYDCTDLDIVTVTGVGANSISHAGLSKAYASTGISSLQSGRVTRVDPVRYFIGVDATGQRGLWREAFINNAVVQQELIKGVEDMQILYGITDATSDTKVPLIYVRADEIAGNQWRRVVSAKIAMLVTSNYLSAGGDADRFTNEDGENYINNNTYNLLDVTVGPFGDQTLRQVVSTEVFFRNQQFEL